jgi:hypothetical protein
MYDFDNDIATVYTGETDIRISGLIDTYRRLPRLPHWHGEHCSNVKGASDATKFPSLIQRDDTVYFYRKSVCRAMPTVCIIDILSPSCTVVAAICLKHVCFVEIHPVIDSQ